MEELHQDLLHQRLGPENFSLLLDGSEVFVLLLWLMSWCQGLTKKFQERIKKAFVCLLRSFK